MCPDLAHRAVPLLLLSSFRSVLSLGSRARFVKSFSLVHLDSSFQSQCSCRPKCVDVVCVVHVCVEVVCVMRMCARVCSCSCVRVCWFLRENTLYFCLRTQSIRPQYIYVYTYMYTCIHIDIFLKPVINPTSLPPLARTFLARTPIPRARSFIPKREGPQGARSSVRR